MGDPRGLEDHLPTLPRIYVADALASGAEVATDARYLGAVLRRRPGDEVRLFNGRDGEWVARLRALDKRQAALVVEGRTRAQAPEPGPILAMTPLRRDAIELVVRQACELGASGIHFVRTARTQPARLNLDRLRAIAVEAAEQSERLTVPAIVDAVPVWQFIDAWAGAPLAVALERAGAPPPSGVYGGVLIGPEGGFAPEEVLALRSRPCVRPIGLGPRILRAETAAVAALALLQGG